MISSLKQMCIAAAVVAATGLSARAQSGSNVPEPATVTPQPQMQVVPYRNEVLSAPAPQPAKRPDPYAPYPWLKSSEPVAPNPHLPPRAYQPMHSGMPLVPSYMNRSIQVQPYSGYPGTTYLGYWAPGGETARVGSPYYYDSGLGVAAVNTQTAGGDPYGYHFGPGFYRHSEHGHYRFPYYSYRRPWYHPGFANYNRDTNFHW